MSEYLTYILWRQREQTLPLELERQRVVKERLTQQERLPNEKRVRREHALREHVRQKPTHASDATAEPNAGPNAEPATRTREPHLERVN